MARGAELSRIDLETRFIFPKWLKKPWLLRKKVERGRWPSILGRVTTPCPYSLDMLIYKDRIAVRVQGHEASWPCGILIRFTRWAHTLGLEPPLQLAHVHKGINWPTSSVPTWVEG